MNRAELRAEHVRRAHRIVVCSADATMCGGDACPWYRDAGVCELCIGPSADSRYLEQRKRDGLYRRSVSCRQYVRLASKEARS